MKDNKILVVSNACFSATDSNGRTLAKLFYGVEPKQLAQFFVYGTPDFQVCQEYYNVSDRDALQSFLYRRETGDIYNSTEENAESDSHLRNNKTPLKMLLRELAWKHGKWKGERLKSWVKKNRPDCIFLFLADNAFLLDFSRTLAKECGIPIIAYSTEDYYFKTHNYITKCPSLFYHLFHCKLKKAYRRCEPYIQKGIFNTPKLTEKYVQEFSYPCECVFAKSDIDFQPNTSLPASKDVKVSYLGNLGLNRHKALIEIADYLPQIIPGAKLSIYGAPSEEIKAELEANPNVQLMGFVGYDEVVQVIHQSTLLVHAEYDDAFYTKDLQCAFSTKIADSICSGTPFLIYANGSLAETDFLKQSTCAFVAEDREQLPRVLEMALTDEKKRKAIVEQAEKVRREYFVDCDYFANIIMGREQDENTTSQLCLQQRQHWENRT